MPVNPLAVFVQREEPRRVHSQNAWMIKFLGWYGSRFPEHPGKWRIHSALRSRLGSLSRDEVTFTRDGFQWTGALADYPFEQLFWSGKIDRWEMRHLLSRLRPGDCVLQGGSNFGYFGLKIARAHGGKCKLILCEPHPENFARLTHHVENNLPNRNIECHRVGFSNANKSAHMHSNAVNSGHTHVSADRVGPEVSLVAIDSLVADLATERVDALLLDVEGLEEDALRGAAATISRWRPFILVEIFPPVLDVQGKTASGVVDLLKANSYHLFYAVRDSLIPLDAIPEGDTRRYCFCFHSSRVPADLAAKHARARN